MTSPEPHMNEEQIQEMIDETVEKVIEERWEKLVNNVEKTSKWREKKAFVFSPYRWEDGCSSFFAAKSFQKWDTRERKKIRQKGGLCAYLPRGISQGGLLAL